MRLQGAATLACSRYWCYFTSLHRDGFKLEIRPIHIYGIRRLALVCLEQRHRVDRLQHRLGHLGGHHVLALGVGGGEGP